MAIHRLSDELSRKIAAGEVIERPLSVVKELIENSLDAGARNIEIELEQGGKVLISVKDDGCGIDADELSLAVEKHATSKIAGEDDLEAIATLGYRGEALSSIDAVSRFELYSRRASSPEGAVLRSEDGAVRVSAVPLRPGTTVVVKDLFYNLPARRKFLKTATAEFRRIQRLIQDYAFAYPSVAFTLTHGGKKAFSSSGSGSIEKLLKQVWGDEPDVFSARYDADKGGCTLWWQDCGPQSRFQLITFVNGRRVSDPVIRSAVQSFPWATRGNWLATISLPPEDIDVNVHPAKSEVLFRHSGEVFDLVRKAADKLGKNFSQPSLPQRGAGALAAPADFVFEKKTPSQTVGTGSFSPFPKPYVPEREPHPFSRMEEPFFRAASPHSFASRETERARTERLPFEPARESGSVQQQNQADTASSGCTYFGQLPRGYLIFADADGLLIVDPHAAHERVNYERILKASAAPGGEERLIVPIVLPPTLREEATAQKEELAQLRFSRDENGSLATLPFHVKEIGIGPVDLLRSALHAIEEGSETLRPLLDRFASKACKASVKLTTRLTEDEANALLAQLNACDEPNACPHGRPTVLRLTGVALDKHFGRLGL